MKKWFVLYTKPHQELKVVQQLEEIVYLAIALKINKAVFRSSKKD